MVSLSGLFLLDSRLRLTDVRKEHAPGWGDRSIDRPARVLNMKCLHKSPLPESRIARVWWMNQNDDDLALVRRALAGEEQAAATIYDLRPQLVAHLTSKGAPHGSISEDAVANFLGDCFGARERSQRAATNRVLEMYKGNGPLIAWLKKSCWNYFLDSTRGPKPVSLEDSGEEKSAVEAISAPVSAEPEVIAQIVEALEYAFSEMDPLTLIFLRLVYLEGVSQSDISTVFDCDNSTVSRRLNQGLTALRTNAEAFQRRNAGLLEIQWPDLLAICQSPPGFIYEN
jgi:DNA-directed RNA polymerase specialized sigma24 family protein